MTQREDIALDDEPVPVERRARADVVVSVRLSREEAERLQEAARRSHKTLSQTAREAIVSFLQGGGAAPVGGALWTVASSGNAPVYLTIHGKGEMAARTEGREMVV